MCAVDCNRGNYSRRLRTGSDDDALELAPATTNWRRDSSERWRMAGASGGTVLEAGASVTDAAANEAQAPGRRHTERERGLWLEAEDEQKSLDCDPTAQIRRL
ncbi:hypothetical protein ACP70R_047748 [Stipagrostis hirtigluma subsp. patula]